ncbi:MAG: hypothetical protein ACD_7C00299G0008 [uncultured bacterium]|nr:MAG: hypothetical protein ACD_7C00299G0008 [uncultured bacterium]HBR79627.1 hypothetical protein [Candidatus Moranbacteria bacterium]
MEKKYLQFKISKNIDINLFFEYIKQSKNNKETLSKFIDKDNFYIDREQVFYFVNRVYERDSDNIEKNIKKVEDSWNLKQDFFDKEIIRLFKSDAYPQGNINAYPSIWPIYGRSFDKSLITFPYKNGVNEAVFVLSHEILHIIFYDYIFLKYKFSSEKMSSKKVWDFSEVINVIIQNQKEWRKNYILEAKPYFEHQALYNKLLKLWNKNPDIDFLIKNCLF